MISDPEQIMYTGLGKKFINFVSGASIWKSELVNIYYVGWFQVLILRFLNMRQGLFQFCVYLSFLYSAPHRVDTKCL